MMTWDMYFTLPSCCTSHQISFLVNKFSTFRLCLVSHILIVVVMRPLKDDSDILNVWSCELFRDLSVCVCVCVHVCVCTACFLLPVTAWMKEVFMWF